MPRSSRFPRSFWVRVVAELGAGQSLRAVAQRNGVGIAALTYWRNKLRDEASFVPVVATGAPRAPASGGLLDLAVAGVVVRFGQDVDPGYVAGLVGALRSL